MRLVCLIRFIPVTLLVASSYAQSSSVEDSSDLLEYINQARNSGMSEVAKSKLGLVADLVLDRTRHRFFQEEPTGLYGLGYSSSFSLPREGMTKTEKDSYLKEQEERRNKLIGKLKKVADTDESGFVSTGEGKKLVSTYEFGLKALYIITKEGYSQAALSRGTGYSVACLTRLTAEYNRLVASMKKLGLEAAEPLPTQ